MDVSLPLKTKLFNFQQARGSGTKTIDLSDQLSTSLYEWSLNMSPKIHRYKRT